MNARWASRAVYLTLGQNPLPQRRSVTLIERVLVDRFQRTHLNRKHKLCFH